MGGDDVLSMMIFQAIAMNQAAMMMQNGQTTATLSIMRLRMRIRVIGYPDHKKRIV
jgi:hypothetical protein